MKTDEFYEWVKQECDVTMNSCRVIRSQQPNVGDQFELDRLRILKARCEHQIISVESRIEVALNSGNCSKPSETSCEEISHTTSEKQ